MTYHSQYGQDHWLIHEVFRGRLGGYFVDVGAFHMENGYMSNTYALETELGWSGLLFEANPLLCGPLKRRCSHLVNAVVSNRHREVRFQFGDRGCNSKVIAAGGEVVETFSLTELLCREGAPGRIDFLSIDVEGHELEVVEGLDFNSFSFEAIIVECNGRREAIVTLLKKAGYRFLEHHQADLYFVSSSLDPGLPSERAEEWERCMNRTRPVPTPLCRSSERRSPPP